MPVPTSQQLRIALSRDLKRTAPAGLGKVLNELARKTFTVRVQGATLEFAHKQSDAAFWNGVKYYGSGSRSCIRIRRGPVEAPEPQATTESVA